MGGRGQYKGSGRELVKSMKVITAKNVRKIPEKQARAHLTSLVAEKPHAVLYFSKTIASPSLVDTAQDPPTSIPTSSP